MKRCIIFFSILMCSAKCKNSDSQIILLIPEYLKQFQDCSSKIRLDGIYKELEYQDTLHISRFQYNQLNTSYFNHFLCFYNNGFNLNIGAGSQADSITVINRFLSLKQVNYPTSGVFYVENDNVYMINEVDATWGRNRNKYRFSIFKGEMHGKDSILNFKLIKPYPSLFIASDTIPKQLIFHPFPAKLQVDSTNFSIKKYLTQ